MVKCIGLALIQIWVSEVFDLNLLRRFLEFQLCRVYRNNA
jgi:hypothetical protein